MTHASVTNMQNTRNQEGLFVNKETPGLELLMNPSRSNFTLISLPVMEGFHDATDTSGSTTQASANMAVKKKGI